MPENTLALDVTKTRWSTLQKAAYTFDMPPNSAVRAAVVQRGFDDTVHVEHVTWERYAEGSTAVRVPPPVHAGVVLASTTLQKLGEQLVGVVPSAVEQVKFKSYGVVRVGRYRGVYTEGEGKDSLAGFPLVK